MFYCFTNAFEESSAILIAPCICIRNSFQRVFELQFPCKQLFASHQFWADLEQYRPTISSVNIRVYFAAKPSCSWLLLQHLFFESARSILNIFLGSLFFELYVIKVHVIAFIAYIQHNNQYKCHETSSPLTNTI